MERRSIEHRAQQVVLDWDAHVKCGTARPCLISCPSGRKQKTSESERASERGVKKLILSNSRLCLGRFAS